MRLIFIRHAEPDYQHNCLTGKGSREALALAPRVVSWKPDLLYCSGLERSYLTIEPALSVLSQPVERCEWLNEFWYPISDPVTGEGPKVPWDFYPQYWTKEPQFFDPVAFCEHPLLREARGYREAVFSLRDHLDGLLAPFGLTREGMYYRLSGEERDATVVICAHLGTNCEAVGYLTGISPIQLKQCFFMPPASVTVLNLEERMEGIAAWRIQVFGDTRHLFAAGEPVSGSGAFSRSVFSA